MKRILIIPSCGEVHAGLTEFLERAQPWHVRLGYRIHFLLCEACRRLLATFRRLPGQLRRSLGAPAEAPAEARAVLGRVLGDLAGKARSGD